MRDELDRFDPEMPLEWATTPPASWYTRPEFLELERGAVFRRTWQAVARTDQVEHPGDYVSGDLAGEPWIVLRDGDGALRAFFNVCRHHAACLVAGGGNTDRLTCPYHGWSYDLDGCLRSAPRMAGVQGFDRDELSLVPLEVDTWGPLIFVRIAPGGASLGELMRPLDRRVALANLRFVKRVTYELACNWKVFVDNYLDGGYHVSHLHRGLASQLDLASYRTEIEGAISLQTCGGGSGEGGEGADFRERLGQGAVYAFVYPNFMINRYGPILDTNWVVPLGHDRALTVFDYWFEAERLDADPAFVERSLAASHRVQLEDVGVCESVQRGLGSSAYDVGRYAPQVEQAMHHFHCLLSADVRAVEDGTEST